MAFNNYTSSAVGTSPVTVHTVASGQEAVVIGLNLANVATTQINVDVQIAGVYVVKGAPIPAGAGLSVLDGKIIMEAGKAMEEAVCNKVGGIQQSRVDFEWNGLPIHGYTDLILNDIIVEIKTFEDAFALTGRHDKGMKLATVFGRADGSLCFRLSQYSDGSGGAPTEIIPFNSHEEAVAHVAEMVSGMNSINSRVIDSCEAHNIPIPDALLAAHRAKERESLEKSVEKKRAELKKLEAELAAH